MIMYFVFTGETFYSNCKNTDFDDIKENLYDRPEKHDKITTYFYFLIEILCNKKVNERPSFRDVVDAFEKVILPFIVENEIRNSESDIIELKELKESNLNNILSILISIILADLYNDPTAQTEIGKYYYYNEPLGLNGKTSIDYLKEAANQNQSEALFYLGQSIYNNILCNGNSSQAMEYIIKSSNLGFQEATRFIQTIEKYRQKDSNDFPLVIIIGSNYVGKSYFCNKLNNIYDVSHPTPTLSYKFHPVFYTDSNNDEYYFYICDTPSLFCGGEILVEQVIKHHSFVLGLVMFSVSNKRSFDLIDKSISMYKRNKIDLKREISIEEINAKVERYNVKYIEISCFKEEDIIETLKRISKASHHLFNLEKSKSNNDDKCIIF